jgi:hypothetical protein
MQVWRRFGWVLVLSLGGCSQPTEVVPVPDAPSYMLRIGRVETDGDLGASAFPASEIRMDPVAAGDQVVALLAGGGNAAVYVGETGGARIRLTPAPSSLPLSAMGSDGSHQLIIDAVVLDGYIEEGVLRFDADVAIEGDETVFLASTDPRGGVMTRSAQVRAAAVARVDDIAPTAELSAPATMLGGILPWDTIFIALSEPVTRASLQAGTGSTPLVFESDELRGQIVQTRVRPDGWWSSDPAIAFPDGLADLIPNVGGLVGAGVERIPEIAPRAGFDFEDGGASVLRASTGEMFVATDGCFSGSCLAFRHPEGPGRSELFARLDGSVLTIRARVRLLGETGATGTAMPQLRVRIRAAGDGVPTETESYATITAGAAVMPAAPYVTDSGWQEVTLSFGRSFAGAGVFISFEPLNTYGGAWAPAPEPDNAGRFAPPPAPIPPTLVLVDDLEVI